MNYRLLADITLAVLLGVVPLHADELQHEIYDLAEMNRGTGPRFVRHSPNNEANPRVMPDGEIQVYYSGGRKGPKTLLITSKDGGRTWSKPRLAFEDGQTWQYPRRTLVDRNGNLHMLIFRVETLDVLHTMSTDRGRTWSKKKEIAKGYIGAIRAFIQCKSGRLVFAFHRVIRKHKTAGPTGGCGISSVYSDDNGKTWKQSTSWVLAPCFKNANDNNYGAVEPNIIQLKDGRLWMLCRTQTGKLYEAYSLDEGETWSTGKPSVFHSTSSPPNLLRLPDGRMVLCWSNNSQPSLGVFGKIYVNREALHMAISEDDGLTWRGFREVYLNPLRNGGRDAYGKRGDFGTSYPTMDFTKQGKIILATGQGHDERHRAIFLVDPKWLYETERAEDFSNDMRNLSAYTFIGKEGVVRPRFLGPTIVAHPEDRKQGVMLLARPDAKYAPNAAVWNFPLARKGKLTLDLCRNRGAAPLELALTDHHSHPNDTEARKAAMIRLDVADVLQIEEGAWSQIQIAWDLDKNQCRASCGGREVRVEV